MKQAKGFTLLEMLAALAVFSLITVITYAAVVPAGKGFRILEERRVELERTYLAGRRMRFDVSYLSPSLDWKFEVLQLEHDMRGGIAYDQLWLLVREMGKPSLSLVHYYLDEEADMLVRETTMPWARDGYASLHWEMGHVTSFEVQAMDMKGQWQDVWAAGKSGQIPRALRIRMEDGRGARELILPVFVGSES